MKIMVREYRNLVYVARLGWMIRSEFRASDGEALANVNYRRPTLTNLRLRLDPPVGGQGVLAGPHPTKPTLTSEDRS